VLTGRLNEKQTDRWNERRLYQSIQFLR
jgi:hypothetical protein